MRKGIAVSALFLLLTGCGETTLDTTNSDTFKASLTAMLKDRSETERLAIANALLTIEKKARTETVYPSSIYDSPKTANNLLNNVFLNMLASEMVQNVGTQLNGKNAEELLVMKQSIADEAHANWVAKLKSDIADAEINLAAAREAVVSAEKAHQERLKALENQLALLDDVIAIVSNQTLTHLRRYAGRGLFDVKLTNNTTFAIEDVDVDLAWEVREFSSDRLNGFKASAKSGFVELVPGASIELQHRNNSLSFTAVVGGLKPNEKINYSALVRGVVLANGTKLERRSIQRELDNKRGRKFGQGTQSIQIAGLNERLEQLQENLSKATAE